MTIATFHRDLFAIPELRFLHPRSLLSDELNVDGDIDNLAGSAKALATARKILRVAKSRYGWSDSEIEELFNKVEEDPKFAPGDRTARVLMIADNHCLNAYLAEDSAKLPFWLNLDSEQREGLLSYSSSLQRELPELSKISVSLRFELSRLSVLYSVNFTRLFLDLIENYGKIVDNAARIEEILEKREGKQPRVLNFSKMTQSERDAAVENYKSIRQARIDCLTPERLEESNKQFERALELVDKSRE
ncbi:hypothetical protein [Chamaesiphon polymorphus]|nr:hypothetical protein [Chamaesiphon polymorphus]